MARVLALLAMTGCAGGSNIANDFSILNTSSAGLSPSAAVLLEQAKNSARTRTLGAASGAVVGGGGAAVAGSGIRNFGTLAALIGAGALVGAGLGYAAGAYVDARNQEATGRQTELGSLIQAADADVARYEQTRLAAEQVAEESGQEILRLNTEYAAGRANAAAYRDQARSLDASIVSTRRIAQELEGNIALMDRDIADMRQRRQDSAPIEDRRGVLQAEHASLLSSYQRLLQTVDTVPAEARTLFAEKRR
jgi:hypothetical protein